MLLAPLDPASTAGKAVLLVERTAAGRLGLPAFSSAQAFAAWGVVPTRLAVRVPELFRAALLQGIDAVQLDPAGPVKVTLGSWEVRRIAAGSAPAPHGSPDRDRRSALGLPDPPLPDAFRQAIADRARSIPGIRSVAVSEGDPVRARRHLVIGIRAEPPVEPLIEALRGGPAPPDQALVNYLHLTDDARFAALERRATVYRA